MRRHDPENAGDPFIDNKAGPEPAKQLIMNWHAGYFGARWFAAGRERRPTEVLVVEHAERPSAN